MIRRIVLAMLLMMTCALAVPTTAGAAFDPFQVNCGDAQYANSTVCQTTAADPSGPGGVIFKITTIVRFVAGALAVCLIIYGGIKYITANGDASKIESAKNTIVYSLVGLAVIVLAAAIINFVVLKL